MGDTEMTNNVSEDDRKLFAGGLPQETTEAELKEYFGQFGTVASVNIKMDAMTGRSRGFAFIVYEDVSSLDKVLKDEFHNFKNKKVAVKKAASKQGKIYVGKFNTPITEDEIKQHFSQYGNVVEVQRPVDRSKNNEPKNFCFVTFEKEETANTLLKKASESVHGQEVELKKVTLKQEGGMRGGRGGGMRGGMGRGQGGHGGWGGGYDAWGGYGGGWGDYGGWGGYGAHSETPILSNDKIKIQSCNFDDAEIDLGLRSGSLNNDGDKAQSVSQLPVDGDTNEKPRSPRMIFACSSSSTDKILDGFVSFETCDISHDDFDAKTGEFSCQKDGVYSIALSSLMKSERNNAVNISVMLKRNDQETKMLTRTLGTQSQGQDLELDLGVSNSIVAPLALKANDVLRFSVKSEGSGSGILNSDSQILKISAYQMDEAMDGLMCKLKDEGSDALVLDSCAWKHGFESLEGQSKITINTPGFYKLAMGGDLIVSGGDEVAIGLDVFGFNMLTAKATMNVDSFDMKTIIPVTAMAYVRLQPLDLSATVKSNLGKSGKLLDSGFITLERVLDDADFVTCTNTGPVDDSIVSYTRCQASNPAFGEAMDNEKGLFQAPEDGYYEVSFTGLLYSASGDRVWATLYKLQEEDTDKSDPNVRGASFLGMFAETANKEALTTTNISASTTLVTIEKLQKGEKLCIGLGRWDPKNEIIGSDMNTVHFNVRKL